MNRFTRLDTASICIAEIAIDLELLITAGAPVAPDRLRPLAATLAAQGTVIEDCAADVAFARQVLTIGRDGTPNAYLLRRLRRLPDCEGAA